MREVPKFDGMGLLDYVLSKYIPNSFFNVHSLHVFACAYVAVAPSLT